MASAQSASLIRGSGAEPPAGSRGKAPGGGSSGRNLLKLKAFCQFSYKKWIKVKNLNENLPPCLRQTVSRRHDPALSFGQ